MYYNLIKVCGYSVHSETHAMFSRIKSKRVDKGLAGIYVTRNS